LLHAAGVLEKERIGGGKRYSLRMKKKKRNAATEGENGKPHLSTEEGKRIRRGVCEPSLKED